jgi:hypothetical protein
MSTSVNPPTKAATPPPPLKKPTPPPPPATTVTSAATSKTTNAARKTSFSDIEKELQEFDIDLDKDDVSDAENGQTTGVYKKFGDEDEVNTFK